MTRVRQIRPCSGAVSSQRRTTIIAWECQWQNPMSHGQNFTIPCFHTSSFSCRRCSRVKTQGADLSLSSADLLKRSVSGETGTGLVGSGRAKGELLSFVSHGRQLASGKEVEKPQSQATGTFFVASHVRRPKLRRRRPGISLAQFQKPGVRAETREQMPMGKRHGVASHRCATINKTNIAPLK